MRKSIQHWSHPAVAESKIKMGNEAARVGRRTRYNQADTMYKDCCYTELHIWPCSNRPAKLSRHAILHLVKHTANVVGPTRCTPVRMSVVMV